MVWTIILYSFEVVLHHMISWCNRSPCSSLLSPRLSENFSQFPNILANSLEYFAVFWCSKKILATDTEPFYTCNSTWFKWFMKSSLFIFWRYCGSSKVPVFSFTLLWACKWFPSIFKGITVSIWSVQKLFFKPKFNMKLRKSDFSLLISSSWALIAFGTDIFILDRWTFLIWFLHNCSINRDI